MSINTLHKGDDGDDDDDNNNNNNNSPYFIFIIQYLCHNFWLKITHNSKGQPIRGYDCSEESGGIEK